MNQIFRKEDIVREISNRTGFSVTDIRKIMNCFQDIFIDIIYNRDSLHWVNLFKLRVKKITKPHKAWDVYNKKMHTTKGYYRIQMIVSRRMTIALRNYLNKIEEKEKILKEL